jgi:hypothetical protein
MMKRSMLRSALVSLVAVLALGAVAAASASALTPEFALKPGGAFPVSIGNSLHTGEVSFDWPAMNWGTCTKNKTEGTITGTKAVSLTLEWTGCRAGQTGQWHSEGAPEGTIVVTGTGTLAYISRSTGQIGIVFAIKEVKLLFGSGYIMLRGNMMIPVNPLNTETNKFAMPIHETGESHEQEVRSYETEGGVVVPVQPEIVFGNTFKRAGIELQGGNELTTNQVLAVKALSPPPNPQFSLGGNDAFPVALEGSSPTRKTTLESASGVMSCEGVNTKGTITGKTTVSPLTYELRHCKRGTEECKTAGAEAGAVVLTGSANLFNIKKSEDLVGLVFTIGETNVTCPSAELKVRGTLVVPVTPVGNRTKQLTLTLNKAPGEETFQDTYITYENEKEEVISTKLELNFGTGYKRGLLGTGGLELTANKAVMVGV